MICEELGDNEKIVACFCGLSHDVPNEIDMMKFSYSVPLFSVGNETIAFIHNMRILGFYLWIGERHKFFMDRPSVIVSFKINPSLWIEVTHYVISIDAWRTQVCCSYDQALEYITRVINNE